MTAEPPWVSFRLVLLEDATVSNRYPIEFRERALRVARAARAICVLRDPSVPDHPGFHRSTDRVNDGWQRRSGDEHPVIRRTRVWTRGVIGRVRAQHPKHDYGHTMMALAETFTALNEKEAAICIWQRVLENNSYARARVQLAELLPSIQAARAQGLMALAARKLGRDAWCQWLTRRAQLLVGMNDLIADRLILKELTSDIASV